MYTRLFNASHDNIYDVVNALEPYQYSNYFEGDTFAIDQFVQYHGLKKIKELGNWKAIRVFSMVGPETARKLRSSWANSSKSHWTEIAYLVTGQVARIQIVGQYSSTAEALQKSGPKIIELAVFLEIFNVTRKVVALVLPTVEQFPEAFRVRPQIGTDQNHQGPMGCSGLF